MRTNNPDVVVVGAGIAGASIAAVLARGGLEVLLLERQRAYRDRVRGEYMAQWGVLEARAVGLEIAMRGKHAVDVRYRVPYDELFTPSAAEMAKRDNSTIFQDVLGPLCTSHPEACQTLADEAVRLGAGLVRGVTDVRVQAGTRPSITDRNGSEMQVRPRLIIGADGRTSTVRKQSGIHLKKPRPPTWSPAWPSREHRDGQLTSTASGSKETFSSTSSPREPAGYVFTPATPTSKRHDGPDAPGRSASSRPSRDCGRSRPHWVSATSQRQDRAPRSAASRRGAINPTLTESFWPATQGDTTTG